MKAKVLGRLFSLVLLGCSTSLANELTGYVMRVIDGDTVEVNLSGRSTKVRLLEIDCPENDQPSGVEATLYLSALVNEKAVTLDSTGNDRYGRLLSTIYYDGVNINKLMVAEGKCWVYRKYVKDRSYFDLESDAKKKNLGLWEMAEPIPPWDWRQGIRHD